MITSACWQLGGSLKTISRPDDVTKEFPYPSRLRPYLLLARCSIQRAIQEVIGCRSQSRMQRNDMRALEQLIERDIAKAKHFLEVRLPMDIVGHNLHFKSRGEPITRRPIFPVLAWTTTSPSLRLGSIKAVRLTAGNHERFKRVRLSRKGQTDRIQKRIFAERFEQAIHGSVCHHPGDCILINMGGDENDRDFGPLTHQLPLQLMVSSGISSAIWWPVAACWPGWDSPLCAASRRGRPGPRRPKEFVWDPTPRSKEELI